MACEHSSFCCSCTDVNSTGNFWFGGKKSGLTSASIKANWQLWAGLCVLLPLLPVCKMCVCSLLLTSKAWATEGKWFLSVICWQGAMCCYLRQLQSREQHRWNEGRSNTNNLLSCCRDATTRPINGHIKGIWVGAGNTLTNTILP